MKKLLIIFAIIYYSCEQDSLFCWDCVITDKIIIENQIYSTSFNIRKCDFTESEIYQYEKQGYKKTITDSMIIETTKKCFKINN